MVDYVEKNLQECLTSFRVLPGAVAVHTDGRASIRCPIPLSFVNGIALAKFSPETLDAEVEEVVAPYKQNRLPFRWWVTPSSSPPHLGAALEKQDMRKRFAIPGMAAKIADLTRQITRPDGFTIRRATNMDELREWSHTFTIGFENELSDVDHWVAIYSHFGFGDTSPWRQYTGFLNGEPVATSSMFIGEEAVGIYHVVTFPSARGLGIGSHMTLAPVLEAEEMGHKISVLQSSEMGLRVYERLGFKQQFLADFYTWYPE